MKSNSPVFAETTEMLQRPSRNLCEKDLRKIDASILQRGKCHAHICSKIQGYIGGRHPKHLKNNPKSQTPFGEVQLWPQKLVLWPGGHNTALNNYVKPWIKPSFSLILILRFRGSGSPTLFVDQIGMKPTESEA